MKTKELTLKGTFLAVLTALAFTFSTYASSPNSEIRSMDVAVYKMKNKQSVRVHFDNKIGGNVNLKIMDLDGNVLHTKRVKGTKLYIGEFDVNLLPAGKYIVEISNADYITRKIITI